MSKASVPRYGGVASPLARVGGGSWCGSSAVECSGLLGREQRSPRGKQGQAWRAGAGRAGWQAPLRISEVCSLLCEGGWQPRSLVPQGCRQGDRPQRLIMGRAPVLGLSWSCDLAAGRRVQAEAGLRSSSFPSLGWGIFGQPNSVPRELCQPGPLPWLPGCLPVSPFHGGNRFQPPPSPQPCPRSEVVRGGALSHLAARPQSCTVQ